MKKGTKSESRTERKRSPVGLFLEKDLQFTPKQMADFDTIRQQQRHRIKSIAEDLQFAKVRFYGLLRRDTISSEVLDSASSRISELQKAIELQAFQNFREVRALCNAEQKPKYDSMIPGIIEKMWFPSRKGNSHSKESSHPVKH